MRLALRPYVTAGVALVGASVIAVTPVVAPPPEIQAHTVQLSATAIDNPIDVFGPVFERAGTVIRDAIQAQVDDPMPILYALIGKALADGQTLGAIASALGELGRGIATGFPPALAAAFQKAAAGDFTGAIGSFTPVFIGPFFGAFTQFNNFQGYVQHQFDVAGQVTKVVLNIAWSTGPGQLLGVFQIMNAAAGALDVLAEAIPEGDPVKAFNAVQHGVANIATAVLGIADTLRWSNDLYFKDIANILNPPPPDPEGLLGTARLKDLTTHALPATETPASETPVKATTGEVAAVDTAAVSETTPAATGTDEISAPEPAAVEAPKSNVTATLPVTTEPAKAATRPLVRDSLIAIPGKAGVDRGGEQSIRQTGFRIE